MYRRNFIFAAIASLFGSLFSFTRSEAGQVTRHPGPCFQSGYFSSKVFNPDLGLSPTVFISGNDNGLLIIDEQRDKVHLIQKAGPARDSA